MVKRELVALLNSSSWCLVMVERLFLVVPQGCLRIVIVVFSDHTHLLFFTEPMALIIFLSNGRTCVLGAQSSCLRERVPLITPSMFLHSLSNGWCLMKLQFKVIRIL